jgi:integrase
VKWSDVNLEEKSVTIRRSLAETRSAGRFFKEPKNGKARTIAMPGPLVRVLEGHRGRHHQERKALGDEYKDDDLVFARPDGSFAPPWNYAAAVKDLAKRAGSDPSACTKGSRSGTATLDLRLARSSRFSWVDRRDDRFVAQRVASPATDLPRLSCLRQRSAELRGLR